MVNTEKVIKKEPVVRNIIFGIILVLGFVWLHTFIYQNRFGSYHSYFSVLGIVILVSCNTAFFYWFFNNELLDTPIRKSIRLCVIGTAVTSVLMLLALLMELGTDGFSLFGKKEIVLFWRVVIPKKYLFDIWAVVWFPLNIEVIFKAMKKEHFKWDAVFFGEIAIMELTLEGVLIFWHMSYIWQVDLIVLNIVTVVFAAWKYFLPEKTMQKRNVVTGIALYFVIRLGLLLLQCNYGGKFFSSSIYGSDWPELIKGIHEIASNVSFVGTSEYLMNSETVHSWLVGGSKPVLQLLIYGGWISVIALIIVIAMFIAIMVKLLNVKYARQHRNWVMFVTAAFMLTIKGVMGIMFEFGFPYPIALPFLGENGIITDSVSFTLILICTVENYRIQKYRYAEKSFLSVDKLLGIKEQFEILDEFGEVYEEEACYCEEICYETVTVSGKDRIIPCIAERYKLAHREFCVFTTALKSSEEKRFVLELAEGRWGVPNDAESITEEIRKMYIRYKRPDCMEEGEDKKYGL